MSKLTMTLLAAFATALLFGTQAEAQPTRPSGQFQGSPGGGDGQQGEPSQRTPGGPSPGAPAQSPGVQPPQVWGAIGYTADGSYATAWRAPTKADAEANVAKQCAAFGRGRCEVLGFPGRFASRS